MIDEVEQIIKPAAGLPGRPLVQLGLHPPYPHLRPFRGQPRPASIHQRLRPIAVPHVREPADPFAMQAAFPPPDYYGSSAPPQDHRRATRRPAGPGPDGPDQTGTPGWFPRSPSTDRRGRCPALPLRHRHGYAADLHRGLPSQRIQPARKFPARHEERVRAAIQPLSAGFELAGYLRGVIALVPLVHLPVSLAGPAPSGSTSTSRRCRGCFPPSPAFPGSGCPSFTTLLRQHSDGVLSPPLG